MAARSAAADVAICSNRVEPGLPGLGGIEFPNRLLIVFPNFYLDRFVQIVRIFDLFQAALNNLSRYTLGRQLIRRGLRKTVDTSNNPAIEKKKKQFRKIYIIVITSQKSVSMPCIGEGAVTDSTRGSLIGLIFTDKRLVRQDQTMEFIFL